MSRMNAYQALNALLRVGLATFAHRTLPEEAHPIFNSLTHNLDPKWSQDWDKLRKNIQQHWSQLDGPLKRLIDDHQLQLHEAFLLTLAGEMESCHLTNLAVTELQHPLKLNRPGCFLAAALIEELFDLPSYNAQDIHSLNLLDNAILHLEGDGPLPQRCIAMPASLWQILRGKSSRWPGCQLLNTPVSDKVLPAAARPELPRYAAQLQQNNNALVIRGMPHSGRQLAAQLIAKQAGLLPVLIPRKHWQDQTVLAQACRYAGWLPIINAELSPGETWHLTPLPTSVVILLGPDGAIDHPSVAEFSLGLPSFDERRDHWRRTLGQREDLDQLATALLAAPMIETISTTAKLNHQQSGTPPSLAAVTRARQQHSAESLRLLAQVVDLPLQQDDLVLPDLLRQEMDALMQRCQQRERLSQHLGSVLKATLTPGVRALFSGDSGTGKTLAASHLAMRLGAPLYRVDVSAIMNKYVGESEKNVAQLLEHAAASDVVLLFDEADSLFGRRSEARESGERYANMLTNFLLSRIESHPGIVILTTNNRNRIDAAFTRRFDAILEFPLPAHHERLSLWQKHLGESSPGASTCAYLASYCDLSGGHIRNAVLYAGVQTRADTLKLDDLVRGLENEYQKLGRPMPQTLLALAE